MSKLQGVHHFRHINRRTEADCSTVSNTCLFLLTAFRCHQYHTISCTSTVNSRRRSILQYTDTGNIGRIHILHTLFYTVHQYIRFTTINRTDTANIKFDFSANFTTGTAFRSIRSKVQTGYITLQSTGNIRHRTIHNRVIFQCSDSCRNGISFLCIHTYHHNFIQHLSIFLHHQSVTFLFSDFYLQWGISHICNRKSASDFSLNREITVNICNRSSGYAFYHDRSTDNRFSHFVYHLSLYQFLLCQRTQRKQ